jgi:PTH1 family peptidyl-tRNA hydrolase
VKLVVGLGNPGRRYASNRHNVGFRVVERFARHRGIDLSTKRFGGRFGRGCITDREGENIDVAAVLPETFMNRSGEVVALALRYLPIDDPGEDVIVVYDDVDLPFGRLRIRPSGSSAGHRGLEDVIRHLGSGGFPRLRFGVDRPADAMETAEYVLQDFSAQEERELDTHIDTAVEALETMLVGGVIPAMNRFNRQDSAAT